MIDTLTNISLRFAQRSESEQLYDLLTQMGYKPDRETLPYTMAQLSESGADYILAAYDGDRMVGWIHAVIMNRVTSGRYVEVVSLIIDHEYRRQGIGARLIKQASNWAASNNLPKVRVRCNMVREQAHEFYRALGFIINKEQRVFDLVL